MRRTLAIAVCSVALLTPIGWPVGAPPAPPAEAQAPPPNFRVAFSVKFLCSHEDIGNQPFQLRVQSGDYATEVNVHNFTRDRVPILVKAVEATSLFAPTPGTIGAFRPATLDANQAIYIGCNDIRSLLGVGFTFPSFKTGFVEILATTELSVVGVYTAKKCNRDERNVFSDLNVCNGEVALSVVPQRSFPFAVQ